jgi:hypothetical protein
MFLCSSASIDITPQAPVSLAGYQGRTQPFERIANNLEANAILLSTRETSILFVALDLAYVGPDIMRLLHSHASRWGLPASNVVAAASHTHFAPATDRTKPLLGLVDEDFLRFLGNQLEWLCERVFAQKAEPAQLEWSSESAELNVNRRRSWPFPTWTRKGITFKPTIVMAPNPGAAVDNRVDIVTVRAEAGRVRAVIWKYACHPTAFPDLLAVSSEYPGTVRTAVRRVLGDETPVVFWQGFSGDVRPRLTGRQLLSQTIRCGPSFGRIDMETWTRWAEQLAEVVARLLLAGDGKLLDSTASLASRCIAVDELIEDSGSVRSVQFQRVSFGELKILFVAAEVCSPFLYNQIGVGCAGDVFGYLPSWQQVTEGGYEGGEFFASFGLKGHFRPGIDAVWSRTVERLAEKN